MKVLIARNLLLKWPNNQVVLLVLIYTVHLTVFCYNIMLVFQIESTLYNYQNVKNFVAQKKVQRLTFKALERDSNSRPLSL